LPTDCAAAGGLFTLPETKARSEIPTTNSYSGSKAKAHRL